MTFLSEEKGPFRYNRDGFFVFTVSGGNGSGASYKKAG